MTERPLLLVLIFAGLASALALPAHAEQLPFRPYTTSDGLAHDYVNGIMQDSQGFLWFGTNEGLSRYDGYTFLNFGREHGLIGGSVTTILETGDGTIWVGSEHGLAKLNPAARPPATPFETFVPQGNGAGRVRTILESRDGRLWVGTFTGLLRFDPRNGAFESIDLGDPTARGDGLQVNGLIEDPSGDLWIATRYLGLIRRRTDGSLERYLLPVVQPLGNVRAIVSDGDGGLWAGGSDGLAHLVPGPGGRSMVVSERYTKADGLSETQTYALFRTADGKLSVATTGGISFVTPQRGAAARIVSMSRPQGLPIVKAIAVMEDRSENIWVGTDGSGAWKLARDGLTTFTAADGLPGPLIVSFVLDRSGRLYASTRTRQVAWAFTRLDEPPFHTTRVAFPATSLGLGWGTTQLTLQDRSGDWWVPTGNGLVRFTGVADLEGLASARPAAVYTSGDGLRGNDIFLLFADSRSRIWVAGGGCARLDPGRGRFVACDGQPTAFGEDDAGAVWIGTDDSALYRHREEVSDRFGLADGVPEGTIQSIFRDRHGRLWVGSTNGGAVRLDDPTAEKPAFVHYALDEGLPSRQVNCFAEDAWGRIYIGTGRGLVMLEPDTGRIRRFTRADGLAGNNILMAARDADGALWFGMQEGLSRLRPRPPSPRQPPSVLISDASLSGIRLPLSLLGETAIQGIVLSPEQRQIEIGFVGLDFSAGERLRYQYRLEGAEADWSAPTDRRAVDFARLAPGAYRFQVRAVDSDGQSSPVPASVSFTILRPIWQRWWFLALSAVLLAWLAYALYRARLEQALRLERVRTHIATDLHDDIGASLTQIAILNEVALKRMTAGGGDAAGPLTIAAQSAREVVDAMSDVVWAIDPRRDRMEDLVLRMRRFAEDLCAARAIELRFEAARDGTRRLDAQVRRQIHLLFKECIANAVKHSGCSVIGVAVELTASGIVLSVTDDGGGFDPGSAHDGNGLVSMRRRCESLRGRMGLRSAPGRGTAIHFSIPI